MSKGFIVCVYEKIEDESLLKNYAVEAKKAVEKFGGKFLIRGGDKITTDNITTKRPMLKDSIPAIEYYKILGNLALIWSFLIVFYFDFVKDLENQIFLKFK